MYLKLDVSLHSEELFDWNRDYNNVDEIVDTIILSKTSFDKRPNKNLHGTKNYVDKSFFMLDGSAVERVLSIFLSLLIIIGIVTSATIISSSNDFVDDEINISLSPMSVHENDTMFINLTVPSSFNIQSATADMSGVETLDLSLADNSSGIDLWQAIWIVPAAQASSYIATVTLIDANNNSFVSEAEWSVLSDDAIEDVNYSDIQTNETSDESINQTNDNNSVTPTNETIDESNNQTNDENNSEMPVNETGDKINNETASDNVTIPDGVKPPSEDFYESLAPYEITGRLNWSKFWDFFNYYDDWGLMYNQSGNWIWVNDSLDVGTLNVADDARKLTLNFTAPYKGDYKIVLKVRRGALTYSFDPDSNTFNVVYPDFNFLFDYSDIAHLQNLNFDHGLDDGYFWFSVSRDDIPQGLHVSLDPQYTIEISGLSTSTQYNGQRKVAVANVDDIYVVVYMTVNSQYNIVFFKSTNGGSTWTNTSITTETSKGYAQYHPSMAIDSTGKLHVVWEGYDATHTTKLQIRYSVSSNAGDSWEAPVTLTDERDYDQTYPSIAVDSADRLHVVWCGKSGGSATFSQIRYIRYDGGWGGVTDITSEEYNQYNPSIALDSTDLINVVWEATQVVAAYEIRYDFSPNNGDSWNGAQTLLGSASYDQNYPCIAIDSSDKCWVVWSGKHSGSTTNYQIRYISGGGGSWDVVGNITSQNVNHYAPSISIDSRNIFHVVFYGPPFDLDVSNDIRYSKSATAGSSWTAVINLTSGAAGDQQWANALWAKYPETQTPVIDYALIYCNVSRIMYNSSSTLDLDYDPEATYYTGAANTYGGKASTTFITSHTDPNGGADVDDCAMWLGDTTGIPGSIIKLNYNVDNHTAWVSGGADYVSGVSASEGGATNGYLLTWTFTPDWDWPYDDIDFDVYAWTDDESGQTGNSGWTEAGTTTHENELIIYNLTQYTLNNSAYSQDGNTVLTENEWFRGGVGVNCSGVVTYEGTTDVYPPTTAVDVQLWADGSNLGSSYQDETLDSYGRFDTPVYNTTSTTGIDSDYDFNVSLEDLVSGATVGSGGNWTLRNSSRDNQAPTSSIDDITPYIQTSSQITLNSTDASDATGSGLKNITLWYRYSNDNLTWWNLTWWNSSFTYRKKITIDHNQVNASLTNFPLFINITDTDLAARVQPDGDDIAFTNSTGTKLNHEIESYNSTTGQLIAWVNVTSLSSATDTVLYMYYGNSTCTSQQNIEGTWNTSFKAIWHLHETPTATVHDSTANNNDLTSAGSMTTTDLINGTTGKAIDFDGANDYLYAADSASLQPTSVTLLSWYYPRANCSGNFDIGKMCQDKWGNSDSCSYGFWYGSGSIANYTGNFETSDNTQTNPTKGSYSLNSWHFMATTHDGASSAKIYVDGVEGSAPTVGVQALRYTGATYFYMAASHTGAGSGINAWTSCIIDEVWVIGQVLNSSYINTLYNNQNSPSTFASFETEGWINWSNTTNPDTSSPWSWNFNFSNGTGYYEFYSRAYDNVSNLESVPITADAICQYTSGSASLNVTPTTWNMGHVWINDTNATTNTTFTVTNDGGVPILVKIKADNATNGTTGDTWELNDTASATADYNNFTLQYQKNGVSTWTQVNLTYDTFITTLTVGDNNQFGLKMIMATSSSTSNEMSFAVTLLAVAL